MCLYSVQNYAIANKDFIEKNNLIFNDIKQICDELKQDKCYHFRIHKNNEYIFFGDLDNYKYDINIFIEILINFMKENYNLELLEKEVKYTENDKKKGSFHYSIPKWNLSCENLKKIHNKLLKENKDKFEQKNIDTTIYSEHWFRCPNQSKGTNKDGIHKIMSGKMKDFIIEYIPKKSININNIIESLSNDKKIVNKEKIEEEVEEVEEEVEEAVEKYKSNDIVLTKTLSQPQLYIKIFDECYKQERFDDYENWRNVGFALRNIFGDTPEGARLFNYFSQKGNNYDGEEINAQKYKSFVRKVKGYTVATIYWYAIEDNKTKFIEIISKNELELTPVDFSKYIKLLAGNKFIYIKTSDNKYKLYCLNKESFWEDDDRLIKRFIGNDLYNFLKLILVEVYWCSREFHKLKSKLERLKFMSTRKDIVETYLEDGLVEDIKMDNNPYLLGFTNKVLDLKTYEFRKYNYNDYISTTTGYNWREPTKEEMKTVEKLLESIFPIEEERELYLQILSTGLDGRCLEKFTIANGGGGNGKGVLNDLAIKALGNHALLGNNSILFEIGRTGSNPEKANLHKKRLVIFREPAAKSKFNNSILKELTGGGKFSARGHHESHTEKELNLTMIIECNTRPLLAEEPKEAELRRIIDMEFKSSFTNDKNLIDNKTVFQANDVYKTEEWQSKHKYALIKILIEKHKNYTNNNNILTIPKYIADRTNNYLQMSCDIISWFKDNYELTEDKNDTLKVKDMYYNFTYSHNFQHMSKVDKRKYNKSYFMDYISTTLFFKRYYCAKSNTLFNVIRYWKLKEQERETEEFN